MKRTLLLISIIFTTAVNAQDTLWTRCYGGSADEAAGFGVGTSGSPYVSMVSDSEGFIYIATYTASTDGMINNSSGFDDLFVLKLDENGDTVWTRTIGGEGNDRALAMELLSDGNLLIAGKSWSTTGVFSQNKGGDDGFILKMSPDGQTLWLKNFGGTLVDCLFGIKEIPNGAGDIMAYGISGSIDGDINNSNFVGSNKAWLMRLTSAGNVVWSRITNGLINNPDWEESFNAAAFSESGNEIVLLGSTYNFNDINSDDLFVCKYDLAGNQSYKRSYGGTAGDSPIGISRLSGGDYLIGAVIRGGGGNVSAFLGGGADQWLLRITDAGTIVWNRNYGGTNLDYMYGFYLTSEGALQVGSSRSTDNTASRAGFGGLDCWVVQTNVETGDTIRTMRWGSTLNEHAHAAAFRTATEMCVAGRSVGNDGFVHGNFGASDVYVSLFQTATPTLLENTLNSGGKPILFPNPSDGQINIAGTALGLGGMNYHIYDVTGKLVQSGSFAAGTVLADLTVNNSGIYLMRIFNSQTQSSQLFVIR